MKIKMLGSSERGEDEKEDEEWDWKLRIGWIDEWWKDGEWWWGYEDVTRKSWIKEMINSLYENWSIKI